METIEWQDVQRIVLSGYPRQPCSAYVLWRFQSVDRVRKKQWLAELVKKLTPAVLDDPSKPAINLALTASGLRHLGIAEPDLNSSHSNSSREWLLSRLRRRKSRVGRASSEIWEPAHPHAGIGVAGTGIATLTAFSYCSRPMRHRSTIRSKSKERNWIKLPNGIQSFSGGA